jgi:hypothetical protein
MDHRSEGAHSHGGKTEESPVLEVRGLEMSYGSEVLMRDITFTVAFFYTTLNDIGAIKYRHEIMQDLESKTLFQHIRSFAQKMRAIILPRQRI